MKIGGSVIAPVVIEELNCLNLNSVLFMHTACALLILSY